MSAFTDNSNCHDISNDENDNNNGFNGNEDKQRCAEYHSQLVHEFVNITKENISKRIKELCYIINQNTNMVSLNTQHTHYMNMGHSNANNIEFQVNTPQFVNIAMSSITPVIQKHTIVQLGACKKIPKSKNEYKKVARNRLNRNKPKFLGNFVFAPLIFDQLYQFCGNIFQDHQMIVFVSILQDILAPTAVVRFEQTRAQPLIPYNTFVMENKFKNSCITLLRYYKLAKQWEIGSKKPNGKKETAKDVWNCFREMCLPKVAERCRNFSNTTPPNNLISGTVQFTTQNPIIPNSPNRDNMTQDRMSNDGMEYKHNDSHSEYQSVDDNSTQMSISTHHSLRHPQPQLAHHQPQQQHQAMYPSLHLHYGDNSNSNTKSRCTVPFSYHVDNHMNNNNNNDNNMPPQLPLNLQANNSYHSTHSRSSMYSSTINTSGVPSPVSSHFSSRRGSMIDTNNDLPPSIPTTNMFNTFGSQSNQVMHGINNNNNNGNNHNDTNMALHSFSVMANDNFNTINTNHGNNNINDYGGNGIMNNMNNANNMIPNTNNDNIYGYSNNDNNPSSRNSTNDHLQINNNNNYGHITHNVYHQYNINQNNNDNRDNYQNCDNMTTSSNNSSNSSNSSSSDKTANASIENGNDNNETIQTLALPHILQMETSGDFMMNSPMTMNRFNSPNNNHQFSLSSPLATNNNGIDMMIMSPMTTNNNNNGNNQQSVWMPNIENTDFDYSKVPEINSSFATFQ